MLIPYENPEASSYQERYNKQQSRGRIIIECSFGILKNLFQCLRYGLRYDATTSCKIILACACLYNLRFRFAEPEPPPEVLEGTIDGNTSVRNMERFGLEESAEESEENSSQQQNNKQALAEGRLYRDRLAQQYFN